MTAPNPTATAPPAGVEWAEFVPRDQLGELVAAQVRDRARATCLVEGHALVSVVDEGPFRGIPRVRCVRDCGHAGWWLVPVIRCAGMGGG